MSDNIKVVVKVRPLIPREIEDKLSYQWRVINNSIYHLDQNRRDAYFTFDRVYDENTKTCDVYKDIAKPIVEAAVAGFNGTIFAYGQTSSGKTYTMSGTEESPGIIPLAVLNLFEIIRKIPDRDFLVRISYIEIYNETLKDLLNVDKKDIKIHDTLQGVKVDVSERLTTSPEEVLDAMKEGEANRKTGSTNMNEESSRSHSIFQITIESRQHIEGEEEVGCVNVSQLNLVDLAGSERAGQTGATGIRFKEGTHINKSLSALALVIKQLSEDPNKYANFRDSKLTRILQNSLGGNAKTSIICAVTPAAVEETISTLQFANRAKAIKNKPEVNAVTTNATMIQTLTKQLSHLKTQLEDKKNVEKVNVNLQKQITALQRLILNGFGQRSNTEMISGPRRKLQPPRRVTISTLHSIDEDPTPVPKFCTPSLKFNPMQISGASDFVPIQNASKLSSLPEESSNRLITPPPSNKKVNFDEEIIELDSDDDELDENTCSPYHKCYRNTKTPPCILRKNAKQAEKNLMEMEELTEREKLYTPSVVELIEKLEKSTSAIGKLEDQVSELNTKGKEKDSELDLLRIKITQSEEEIKSITSAKVDLEKLCNEYKTKLTDFEVLYETCKTKAKSREEELLSLLEEQNVKSQLDCGKTLFKTLDTEITQFMDMSKDISLVNSDNESSITNTNDDGSTEQIQDLVTDLQTQVAIKNKRIILLEDALQDQNQKIMSLEKSRKELQDSLSSFREKLSYVEDENSYLKSTVETLNSTIKNQKVSLETASHDIKSYNSLIQELQIKLIHKENILDVNLHDSLLEKMITTEEAFLASNENIKNIIQLFKVAIDSRNTEIDNLKTKLTSDTNSAFPEDSLKIKIEQQEKQIYGQLEEIQKLNEKLSENVTTINGLIQDKINMELVETKLTSEIAQFEKQNKELQQQNEENVMQIVTLTDDHQKLTKELLEKDVKVQELSNSNEKLIKKIEDLSKEILNLQQDLNNKEDLIISLNNENKNTQEYLLKAKLAVDKLESIMLVLTGNVREMPDEFINIFSILSDSLNSLETIAADIVADKNLIISNNDKLKQELSALIITHQEEIDVFKLQIENLTIYNNNATEENDRLVLEKDKLANELGKIQEELTFKILECDNVQSKLNEANEDNKNLQDCILSKDNTISLMKEKETALLTELKVTPQDSEPQINKLKQDVKNLRNELQSLSDKLNTTEETRDQILENIQKKILDMSHEVNFEFNSSSDLYERILIILDRIEEHFKTMKVEKVYDSDLEQKLIKSKQDIELQTLQNSELMINFSLIESEKKLLQEKISSLQLEKSNLNNDLLVSSELLKDLQKELKEKSLEIGEIEKKAKQWKEEFTQLDSIMKQQTSELQFENDRLKDIISEKHIVHSSSTVSDVGQICKASQSHIKNFSSQSLSTICFNRLIETLQLNEKECDSVSLSSSDLQTASDNNNKHIENYPNICQCETLLTELQSVQEDNRKLTDTIKQLEGNIQYLTKEQEDARKESLLLIELANELQKKITNHRTNLATLTATTSTENHLLKTQLKVLQHHHIRCLKVCERDIPAFKKQLSELMTILRDVTINDSTPKRFSLPTVLDNSAMMKNDSTLDGDLLMLDTNVTLTTTGDNTLVGEDQTCLDVTQIYSSKETACQTSDISGVVDVSSICSQIDVLRNDNLKMSEKVNILKEENNKLRKQVDKYSENHVNKLDFHGSPIKIESISRKSFSEICEKCKKNDDLQLLNEKLNNEVKLLSQDLSEVKARKEDIEKKYNNLSLEIPSSDALIKKITILDKEYKNGLQEIDKLTKTLRNKTENLKALQEENETLSNQVMESISEVDDLKKEQDSLKNMNVELSEKCLKYERLLNDSQIKSIFPTTCSQCKNKDDLIHSLKEKQYLDLHSKLNRSFSDSDTSSRYNKICTLQNELHAGKEDCKELSEEVTTIRNHLERSNMSIGQAMDLDITDPNIFSFTNKFTFEQQDNKRNIPDIPEEKSADIYTMDKIDCFNYYVEKTGVDKENLSHDVKIIDVMKMFYNNFVTKHTNEVENLQNKLREYDESKQILHMEVNNLTKDYSKVAEELKEKGNSLNQIRNNVKGVSDAISQVTDTDQNTESIAIFKENVLHILDSEFNTDTVGIFEAIIDNIVRKHHNDLNIIMERYIGLQKQMEKVSNECTALTQNLQQMKCQLINRESEYDLLKTQKERINEISSAVTLDIIRKEQELSETIIKGCGKLIKHKVMKPCDIDSTQPLNTNINLLFEHLINQQEYQNSSVKEKEDLVAEVNHLKGILEQRETALQNLKDQYSNIEEVSNKMSNELKVIKHDLQNQKSGYEDLNKIYKCKVEENDANVTLVQKLSEEIKVLKETIENKENVIETLQTELNKQKINGENETKINELLDTIKCLEQEFAKLKSINDLITAEKEAYVLELEKSGETIKQNGVELDKMTSDILILRESVRENLSVIESFKLETKDLVSQNLLLKKQFEEKHLDCLRLETNIKTHEKTAEIQSQMIIRLQKQKQEDAKRIAELTENLSTAEKECANIKNSVKISEEEIEKLKSLKESLEIRITELETELEAQKSQLSTEALPDGARRRRQSIHDSLRVFTDDKSAPEEHRMEAMFDTRPKPDDLFMDVDDDSSSRSTPVRQSRGRESLLSQIDQSDNSEHQGSRPSSVQAVRRRRQSIHDLHRSVVRHTPSPHEHPLNSLTEGLVTKSAETPVTNSTYSEVKLKERLANCEQELEELKERYKQLDEECDTCAEYLREREQQCAKLRKEKQALQQQVEDLTVKLRTPTETTKRTVADASVNTDEDWANLHSVVVDRMSFDAEVEKNKKLVKTVEELRFRKQDLKATITKMQKALEKQAGRDYVRELEQTKSELETCKKELEETKEKYRELDEECEICSQYLREREEQCRRLREAKAALETKLQELQEDIGKTHMVRKKRQSLHDQNRTPTRDLRDVATETSDDLLSYQVEKDETMQMAKGDMPDQVKHLKMVVEKLTKQKAALELQLTASNIAPHAPIYVSTGSAIVQNQQISDVMKENQKLKKINSKLITICKKRGKPLTETNRDHDVSEN